MAGPARTGVLVYAVDVERMATFYQRVLDAVVLHADAEHRVLQSADTQLIIHAIAPPYRDAITIATPAVPRETQAIKPFFTVARLDQAEQTAVAAGGQVWGPRWPGPGMQVSNVCDPEGNIIHLRQLDGRPAAND